MWDAVLQMDHTNLIKILLQSVSSILITLIELVSENQIKDIDFVSRKICSLSHAIVGLLEHDCSVVVVDEERAAVDERRRALTVTDADAEAVVASLGLSGWRRGEERVDAMAVVEELTESKRASEAELEEAFYVFDRDKDGFISATELRNVMRQLGFEEGEELADCEKMIGAFDDDGDGRISFREFASMMNNAV